jgi:hypothetical protein
MHVEQEVQGGEETVLQHVLSADVERTQLLIEEKAIQAALTASAAAEEAGVEEVGEKVTSPGTMNHISSVRWKNYIEII